MSISYIKRLFTVQVDTTQSKKKQTTRRKKKEKSTTVVKSEIPVEIDDEVDPLLLDVVEQEVTISEIDHFEAEEEVVDIDWYK